MHKNRSKPKVEKDDEIRTLASSIASSTSTSRLFKHALEDTFPSKASKSLPMVSSAAEKFDTHIDKEEVQKQLRIINSCLDLDPPPNVIPKQFHRAAIDTDYEAKITALEMNFKEAIAKVTEKNDRNFLAHHELITQNLSINKMISKKLEELAIQMKERMATIEGENKKLKEHMDVLMKMLNQSLEFTKSAIKIKTEFEEFKTNVKKELDEIRALIGIEKAMREMSINTSQDDDSA